MLTKYETVSHIQGNAISNSPRPLPTNVMIWQIYPQMGLMFQVTQHPWFKCSSQVLKSIFKKKAYINMKVGRKKIQS